MWVHVLLRTMSRTVVLGMLRRRAISPMDKPHTLLMERMKHTSHSSRVVEPLTAPRRANAGLDDERKRRGGESEGNEAVARRDTVPGDGGDEEADKGQDPEDEIKIHAP